MLPLPRPQAAERVCAAADEERENPFFAGKAVPCRIKMTTEFTKNQYKKRNINDLKNEQRKLHESAYIPVVWL